MGLPPNFSGFNGLTYPQSVDVFYAVQDNKAIPHNASASIVQQAQELVNSQQSKHYGPPRHLGTEDEDRWNGWGGRRMRYKSTRRRGKTNRRRGKTHRRRHRKH